MKRTLIILGALSVGTAYSQSHKVGINTDNPRASLEVSKAAGIAATEVQGFILPQLTQAERNGMDRSQFVQGLQIYNTDKKCVDIWTGSHWQCIDGTKQDNQGDTPSTPSAVYAITQLGFGGVYKADEALTSDNTVTFKIKNTGAVTSPTMDLSNAVTITNEPGGYVSVVGGQHTSVTIAPGREVTLTYRLQGTPKAGNLKAKLTYNTVYDEAITPVVIEVDPLVPQYVTLMNGERSFVSVYDADYWPYSGPTTATAQTTSQNVDGLTTEPLIDIQGKIPTAGVEVYIPIKVDPAIGHGSVQLAGFPGSEFPVSATFTQDGNSRNIKLSWDPQTIRIDDTYIKAKISAVGQDILLKKLDFQTGMGQDYKGIEVATFRYATTQGGTQRASFVVRLMSGIPDRRFGIKTKDNGGNDVYDHQFIYVPVRTPATTQYNSSGLSNTLWLNNNLGAEYTRVGSPVFDPGQQAKAYNDYNAFGSLWQYGRPADGHELVTYTSATTWQFKYGTTTTPTTTYPPQPTENKTVIPTVTTDTATGIDTTSMWFAGTTLPTGFPVTKDNSDNDVCPMGFVIPGYDYFTRVMTLQKPFGKMDEHYLRFPSNPKNVTNLGNNPDYDWKPKLWTNDVRYQAAYSNGNNKRSFIVFAQATDLVWNAALQQWSDWDVYPTTLFTSNSSPTYRYQSDYQREPYMFRKIANPSNNRINQGIYGDAGWYGRYSYSAMTTRTINDSYAIRCIKKP